MKFDEDDMNQIGEFIKLAQGLQPLADNIAETINSYGPAIYSVMEKLYLGTATLRIKTYEKYREKFGHDEALELTMLDAHFFTAIASKTQSKGN